MNSRDISSIHSPAPSRIARQLVERGPDRCMVAPHPDLRERIARELARLRATADPSVARSLGMRTIDRPGLNDGMIFPESAFPESASMRTIRDAAATRAPLRGTLRVIVVLVDFADKAMTATPKHFKDLFFSTGVLPKGSVKEYYQEVTNSLIDIAGEVVGPYRMPQPLSAYAHNESGLGDAAPNAQTLAYDAAVAANPHVNFTPYDNDGNGYVDAFIIIHAGPGGEVTGSHGDIWSHKWVLADGPYTADSTKIYGYLTVPEDSKIGVCAHELGHLLFGWPDLYDTDYSSEGLGNWCLMAGGSWNGGGDQPAHPSAWCKASQGWVSVVNQSQTATINIPDVKTGHVVYRLWKNATIGREYFLVENRQRSKYDGGLPGEGLLIYHVDDSVASNTNEAHPKVKLMEADGLRQMQQAINRGDAGDPFPGNAKNRVFTKASNPTSRTYSGRDSCVSLTNIADSGPVMAATVTTHCPHSGGTHHAATP